MSDVPASSPSRSMRRVAEALAARLLAREWALPSIAQTIGDVLGGMAAETQAALARQMAALGEDTYPPSPRKLVEVLLQSNSFRPAPDSVAAPVLEPALFAPVRRLAGIGVPALATAGDLAAWFGLSAEELDWFSDARHGQEHAGTPALRHYHHVLTRKRSGRPRLLEAPKTRLKAMQRRILRDILALVPVHDSAHGFVAGRSCLTGAQVHASEAVVARFDLAEFFPSIGAPRVHGIFRALGYPSAVARHLTGLCTTVAPLDAIDRLSLTASDGAALRSTYRARHLPQGAPTSPALANLLAWRLDRRLHGLARAAEANYTRYADDLAFSGNADFARSIGRFGDAVARIAHEEGFCLNPAKTRVMLRHQRQSVTGLVVNDHLAVSRDAVDTLRAILHNCARGDPREQNRAGVADFRRHLEGRVAWVEQVDPRRGEKLWALFRKIEWGD